MTTGVQILGCPRRTDPDRSLETDLSLENQRGIGESWGAGVSPPCYHGEKFGGKSCTSVAAGRSTGPFPRLFTHI